MTRHSSTKVYKNNYEATHAIEARSSNLGLTIGSKQISIKKISGEYGAQPVAASLVRDILILSSLTRFEG